jgi:hypothetical protein
MLSNHPGPSTASLETTRTINNSPQHSTTLQKEMKTKNIDIIAPQLLKPVTIVLLKTIKNPFTVI